MMVSAASNPYIQLAFNKGVCPGVRYHDDVQWSGVGLHCRLESEIQVFEVLMAKLTS